MNKWFRRFFGIGVKPKDPAHKELLTKEISISGNGFITQPAGPSGGSEEITEKGLQNWESPAATVSIYFWMSKSESLDVGLRIRIPKMSKTTVSLSLAEVNAQPISGMTQQVNIDVAHGGEYQIIRVGKFEIGGVAADGFYVRFDLKGVMKTGQFYAEVTHLLVSHEDPDNEIVFNTFEESYFGRRGPSVHLSYPIKEDEYTTEYFYNEVHVPEGYDYEGLYAMACGFQGGYFGIQVNGPVQRRVLFSIWSEFNTEDPEQIPDEYKVRMVRKGQGTVVGEFGNEGAGAQSFTKFNWTAGTTYKFLVQCKPLDEDNTLYTAWFKRPESDDWTLVTSFQKPKVSLHLRSLYSFLENFLPETGHVERKAFFGNQWVRDTNGKWHELVEARFTGDATSRMGRRDFAGGLHPETNLFYLRHCGFFSDRIPTDQTFSRQSQGVEPDIDIENLP